MRAYFDEGVSKQDNMKVQQKKRSAFVIQASKRIEEAAEKMDWETKVKVVTIFPDDATKTKAETTAAVEAARAICCLVQTGSISFDLDGNLIEEWDKNGKKNQKQDERTHKRETPNNI